MGKRSQLAAVFTAAAIFFWTGCLNTPLPPEEGSLSAHFLLAENTNSEGVEVILPGTAYRGFTDREGKILFDHLPTRSYELLARAEGYLDYRESNIEIQAGDHIFLGRIQMEPRPKDGIILGRVEVAGVPEATPEVRLLGSDQSVRSATDGRFEFSHVPAGSYDLAFYYPGYAAKTPLSVTIEAGTTLAVPKVVLQSLGGEQVAKGGILTGRVRLEGARESGEVEVFLPGTPVYGKTKPDGTFWLDKIESGTHTILFQKPGYLPYRIASQRVLAATITEIADILLDKVSPSQASSASVSAATPAYIEPGTPGIVSGLALYADRQDHSGIAVKVLGTQLQTETDSSGAFLLADVPPGRQTIRFEADGYDPFEFAEAEVPSGDVLRLPRADLFAAQPLPPQAAVPSRVYGQVLLGDRAPEPGIQVALEGTAYLAATDREGLFLFNDVLPGDYVVVVNREGYHPFSEGVEVGEGEDVPIPVITLEPDIEYLEVIEANPSDGAKSVEVTDRVTLRFRFNKRLLAGTVSREVFVDPPVATQVSVPEIDLLQVDLLRQSKPGVQFETDYVVTLGTGIESPEKHHLEEPYRVRFKTGGPRILGSIPASGERGIVLVMSDPIRIFFNDEVDLKSLRQRLTISPDSGEVPVILAQRTAVGSAVQIQIQLRENRDYKITIPQAVRTLAGKRFENTPYTIKFKSGSFDDLPNADTDDINRLDSFDY